MKRLLLSALAVVLLLPLPAFSEIQTVTKTIRQSFGGSQSADDARIAAIARAKREALEQAGTYVEALTIVKDSRLDKDEILAVTAGVCQSEVISAKNYHTDDAFGIEVNVKVTVDTAVLGERVKKLLADRTHLDQLNSARKKEKKLLDKIAYLVAENNKLKNTYGKKQRLKKEFQKTSQGLTAIEWFDKAIALWEDKEYTDPDAAIHFFDKAIKLKSDFAEAFNNRGIAYYKLGQYSMAIKDFNQAIRLKPDFAEAFYNRGAAYGGLGQRARAIKDYNQVIRLKPDFAGAFYDRGVVYYQLGQYSKVIEDFSQAIRLKPDYEEAIYNRGVTYYQLGQYSRAIEDFNQIIRLKPDDAKAFRSRGGVYKQLGQHSRAIEDFNQTIRLKPDDVNAFYSRGYIYYQLGQHSRAIEDFNQTIRLKPDEVQAFSMRGLALLSLGSNSQGCQDIHAACKLGNCKPLEFTRTKGWCE